MKSAAVATALSCAVPVLGQPRLRSVVPPVGAIPLCYRGAAEKLILSKDTRTSVRGRNCYGTRAVTFAPSTDYLSVYWPQDFENFRSAQTRQKVKAGDQVTLHLENHNPIQSQLTVHTPTYGAMIADSVQTCCLVK